MSCGPRYFNPQGPRGPRPSSRTGSIICLKFQSTRPSRASTGFTRALANLFPISIHKALAGLDRVLPPPLPRCRHFNPQGPRGPRLVRKAQEAADQLFQSTRPSRASTRKQPGRNRAGGNFNPQGPRGPRPSTIIRYPRFTLFQSTRPSRASTSSWRSWRCWDKISIHKALAGLDDDTYGVYNPMFQFQSTRPSRASTT